MSDTRLRRKYGISIVTAIVSLMVAAGCVKRTEFVSVLPDGDIVLTTLAEGDPDDVREGDPLPTEAAGWQTSERIETDRQDKETLHRAAQLCLAAGQPIPTSYAPAGSPMEKYALRFTTHVALEHTPEGTYYHFRRVYHGRPYAFLEYLRAKRMENDTIKGILEKAPETLTDDERGQLARALLEADRDRQLAFFDQAVGLADVEIPQHIVLLARTEVANRCLDEKRQTEVAALLGELLGKENTDAGVLLDATARNTIERAERAVQIALMDNNVSQPTVDAFCTAINHARRYFEFTQDICDDGWAVGVSLPGKIVAYQWTDDYDAGPLDLAEFSKDEDEIAHKVGKILAETDFEPGYAYVTWSFEGEELLDRDVVVAASSFVPASAGFPK